MFFSSIIRAAGLSPDDFSVASRIPVTLFDRKGREINDPDIHYAVHLFEKNPQSLRNFEQKVRQLNEKPVANLTVTMEENQVLFHGNGECNTRFSRLPPADVSMLEIS